MLILIGKIKQAMKIINFLRIRFIYNIKFLCLKLSVYKSPEHEDGQNFKMGLCLPQIKESKNIIKSMDFVLLQIWVFVEIYQ